jgi:hypothetical protein
MHSSLKHEKRFKRATNCCTQEGQDFLRATLTPWHKEARVGMPDGKGGRSVILAFEKTLSISVPAAAGTGNWDCHIAVNKMGAPKNTIGAATLSQDASAAAYAITNNGTPAYPNAYDVSATGPLAGSIPIGLITVCTVPEGDDTFIPGGSTVLGEYQVMDLEDFLDNSGDAYRIIGGGLKCENTTAVINKQGSVVCYHNDIPPVDFNLQTITGTSVCSVSRAKKLVAPPCSRDFALKLKNDVFLAEEGALIPLLVSVDQNDYSDYSPQSFLYQTARTGAIAGLTSTAATPYQAKCYGSFQNTIFSIAEIDRLAPPVVQYNLDQNGMYFTGLSDETTLSLTVSIHLEVCVDANSVFAPLAKDNNHYDPMAMQLYSRVQDKLPAGAPADHNTIGEWLRNGINAFVEEAADIASVGNEVIQDVGTVSESANTSFQKINTRRQNSGMPNKKSKPLPKPPQPKKK